MQSLFAQPHWEATTCCRFPLCCKPFMGSGGGGGGGGNKELGISEWVCWSGTGIGLTEPESLCIEPRLLPSKWVIFFFINFLSLARRFWNQIFTYRGAEENSFSVANSMQCSPLCIQSRVIGNINCMRTNEECSGKLRQQTCLLVFHKCNLFYLVITYLVVAWLKRAFSMLIPYF